MLGLIAFLILAIVAWIVVSFVAHVVFGHFLLVLVLVAAFLLYRHSKQGSSV